MAGLLAFVTPGMRSGRGAKERGQAGRSDPTPYPARHRNIYPGHQPTKDRRLRVKSVASNSSASKVKLSSICRTVGILCQYLLAVRHCSGEFPGYQITPLRLG